MPLLSRARRALALAALPPLVACSAPATSPAPLPPLTSIMVPPAMAGSGGTALVGPRWGWRETLLAGDRRVASGDAARYTLEFADDGRVLLRADCNRGSARYTTAADGSIAISAPAITKMGCQPGSQEVEFLRQLALVNTYRFAEGELVLALGPEGGAMRLRPLDR